VAGGTRPVRVGDQIAEVIAGWPGRSMEWNCDRGPARTGGRRVKILFGAVPGAGHLLPLLSLADAAADAGHHAAFLTAAGMAGYLGGRTPLPAGPAVGELLAETERRTGGGDERHPGAARTLRPSRARGSSGSGTWKTVAETGSSRASRTESSCSRVWSRCGFWTRYVLADQRGEADADGFGPADRALGGVEEDDADPPGANRFERVRGIGRDPQAVGRWNQPVLRRGPHGDHARLEPAEHVAGDADAARAPRTPRDRPGIGRRPVVAPDPPAPGPPASLASSRSLLATSRTPVLLSTTSSGK
jgi:hypothetical protein